MLKKLLSISFLGLLCVAPTFAQDEMEVSFDEAALPRAAAAVERFVLEGWMIEAQVSGDLNKDAAADVALKLVEKPAADSDPDNPAERARVLVVLLKRANGEFERAATAKNLLQCTRCGGAFYGVVESPAEVEITKGVLIARQDAGSRNVTETTFKFRYEPTAKRFALIGYDMTDRDRATGETVVESTNYLTGAKTSETLQYDQKLDKDIKKSSKRTKVSTKPQYLENVNYETFGGS